MTTTAGGYRLTYSDEAVEAGLEAIQQLSSDDADAPGRVSIVHAVLEAALNHVEVQLVDGPSEPVPAARYDWGDDPTAQDVIDALRIAAMAQDNPHKVAALLKCLLEWAPDTESGRGIDLLLRLISEATLKVEVAAEG